MQKKVELLEENFVSDMTGEKIECILANHFQIKSRSEFEWTDEGMKKKKNWRVFVKINKEIWYRDQVKKPKYKVGDRVLGFPVVKVERIYKNDKV